MGKLDSQQLNYIIFDTGFSTHFLKPYSFRGKDLQTHVFFCTSFFNKLFTTSMVCWHPLILAEFWGWLEVRISALLCFTVKQHLHWAYLIYLIILIEKCWITYQGLGYNNPRIQRLSNTNCMIHHLFDICSYISRHYLYIEHLKSKCCNQQYYYASSICWQNLCSK